MISDLLSYIPTVLLLSAAVYIFYLRYLKKKEKIRSGEVLIPVPQGTSTVEALTALQQAVSQAEATIQGINIALLKIRALLLSNYPEVFFLLLFTLQLLFCTYFFFILPNRSSFLCGVENLFFLKFCD